MGTITLLYKGKGLPRDQVASYRPITLLNTDYKIVARALACRWGPAADEVVDPTQTAFIPNRWIGDNVLAHLEEIDFCQACQVEGTILFIDSAKAYDRLDVDWLLRCLQHLGFGPNARRWVSLLHCNRQACVRFNGWRTAPFPIASGVAQGSPLSPLLYVLAAQPLAAHIRGLAGRGELRGIPLPDGSVAPYTHQHADDLTVHVATLADARAIMHGPIRLFCEASGAEVHAGKAKGLHLGVPAPFEGVDAGTGILFVGSQEPVRHLGILVGRDTEHCRQEMYKVIAASLERRVASWATTSLSYLGRTYVARQCMASKYTYHAAFVPAPQWFLRRTADLLATFVACGERAGPGRVAAKMYPNRAMSSLPWEQGGIRFPDTHAIVIALQASVISRLFTPRPAAWKGMFLQWLGRPPPWVQAHPSVPRRDIDTWGLGARAIFCTARLPLHLPSQDAHSGIPARVLSYIRAVRRLYPHREGPATSFSEVMAEPLFYNAAITGKKGAPLGGPSWHQCAQAGVRRVSDLRRLYRPQASGPLGVDIPQPPPGPPQHIAEALLQALPPAWRAMVLQPEAPIPDWSAWEGHPGLFLRRLDPVSPGTAMMLQVYQMHMRGVGATGRVEARGQLVAPTDIGGAILAPAIVDVWDGPRPGRTLDPASRTFVFAAGHLWPFDPRPWMVGSTPILTLSASIAAQRWRDIRLWETQPGHTACLPVRPPIWEDDWDPAAAPLTGLRAAEQRQLQQVGGPPAAGPPPPRKRRRGEGDAATPASPSLRHPPVPRPSVAERIASREPLEGGRPGPPRARLTDCTDVLAPLGDDRPRSPWHHVWGAVAHSGLCFVERACAWRVLHGCVFTGTFKRYVSMPVSPAHRFCSHSTCGAPHYDTLSHVFLTCPLARQAWGWLGTLWESLTGHRFPMSVAVLLADDRRPWRPAPDAEALWVRLRLLCVAALWKAHCRRHHGDRTPLVTVVAGLVSRVRALMASDAALVTPDGPLVANVGGDTVSTPLPTLTREAFLSRWGLRDVLCSWPAAAARPLFHLTLVHPAPLPPYDHG
ncbi:MAG: reverse transcriptase domain-containing protein [Limnohabitans sp.]